MLVSVEFNEIPYNKKRPIGIVQNWKSDLRNFVSRGPKCCAPSTTEVQETKGMLTVKEQRVAAIGANFPPEDLTFAKIG